MFQASLCLALLAIGYGVHAKHMPFVNPDAQEALALAATSVGSAATAGRRVSAVPPPRPPRSPAHGVTAADGAGRGGTARTGRRMGVTASSYMGATALRQHVEELLDFNVLETVLLASCVAVVLSGMVFVSAEFVEGSIGSGIVTALVIICVVGSIALFFWMLAHEMKRSCRHSRRLRAQRLMSAALRDADGEKIGSINPMHVTAGALEARRQTAATLQARKASAASPGAFVVNYPAAATTAAAATAAALPTVSALRSAPAGFVASAAGVAGRPGSDPRVDAALVTAAAAIAASQPCAPPASTGASRPVWWLQRADDDGEIWYHSAPGEWEQRAPPPGVAVVSVAEAAAAQGGWVWCTDPTTDRAFVANTISGAAMWEEDVDAMPAQ